MTKQEQSSQIRFFAELGDEEMEAQSGSAYTFA